MIAGHNPGVHGAVLTDALSSRFAAADPGVHRLRPRRPAQDRPPGGAGRAQPRHPRRTRRDRLGTAAAGADRVPTRRRPSSGVEAATANLVGIAPEEDRDTVATVVRTAFGAARHPAGPRPPDHPAHPDRPGRPAATRRSAATGGPDPHAPRPAPTDRTTRDERARDHRTPTTTTDTTDTTDLDGTAPRRSTTRPDRCRMLRSRMARRGGRRSPGR